MRISDWSSDVCSSDLPVTCLDSQVCRASRSSGDKCSLATATRSKAAIRESGESVIVAISVCLFDAWGIGGVEKAGEGSGAARLRSAIGCWRGGAGRRSEEHTSELQSLMRISYAVFCLKKK